LIDRYPPRAREDREASRRERVAYRALGGVLVGAALALSAAHAEGGGESLPRARGGPPAALVARGEYLLRAAGCVACHTDLERGGAFLAGGRALITPFGTFYPPNITSHPRAGIGAWRLADLTRALREGVGPRGERYYPAFPYPAYTGMSDEDIAALYAYLMRTPPVAAPSRPHRLVWFVRPRIVNRLWSWLFLTPGPYRPNPGRSARWNRGAYLVRHLAHCGQCHTPRNRLGGLDGTRELAGTVDGPEGTVIPNITRDPATGIGDWTRAELARYLALGEIPEGPYADGLMAEVIEEGLQHLEEADIEAIVEYVWSLPPQRNEEVARRR